MEVIDARESTVGRLTVRRALPTRGRRTVGAWCFADHMGQASVTENSGLDVGPHPHSGLQTVTWLIDGQALHKDSLGSEQVISPGQLNLMTAGNGVAHAEEATGHYRGVLEGIQLWVAQPEATRHGEPAFEHHADLPRVDVAGGTATVLIGDFAGVTSPARRDTALVGIDLNLHGDSVLPLARDFEYAVIVLHGAVTLYGESIGPGRLAFLGDGLDQLDIAAPEGTRALLLGGEPFESRIEMWWNFVARDRDELAEAYRSWSTDDGRFGRVDSALPRIPVAAPFWLGG
jgi:redox-sensitive bicupin YhaK (pirin superfamily)